MNFFATDEWVTSVAGSTMADALMVLCYAGSVYSASIDAWILAVEVREASFLWMAVLVFETLDLAAAVTLIVGVTDIVSVRTGTLWKMIVNYTDGSWSTFHKATSVLTSSFAIMLVKLAHLGR